MATAENIIKVRYELADTDVALPILSDSEYSYFLEKNSDNIRRAMLDAAKTILFKLSMRSDETVDIFSIKGSKAASEYRQALHLFIRDPNFNPALTLANAFAGGIYLDDMQANVEDTNVNAVVNPTDTSRTFPENYFEV
jgi:hypothetical protein